MSSLTYDSHILRDAFKNKVQLDLESIMSGPRMDGDLKIFNLTLYHFKNFDWEKCFDFEYWNKLEDFLL